jgi:hypothetical protein
MSKHELRRGDLVEVRTAAEILQTLDETGSTEGMPFMPEMIPHCGRRFTVERRAEKLCDTYTNFGDSRGLPNTVYLEDLRCDGGGHGGCQAECRLYWNEAWLRPVGSDDVEPPPANDPEATRALVERVTPNATRDSDGPAIRYRCQATEMGAASVRLSTVDPRPYVRELTSQNVTVRKFVRVMSRAAVMQPLHKLGRMPTLPLKGERAKSPPSTPLDLQPGEWVQVRPKEEIAQTLTDKGANRGLYFDREMMALCGEVRQVRSRVNRIINEQSGEMIELKSDCIKLENAVCTGELSTGRWFCPREIYSYWRECWLERVEAPQTLDAGPVATSAPAAH